MPRTEPSLQPESCLQKSIEQSSLAGEAPATVLLGAVSAARAAVPGTAGSVAVVRSAVAVGDDELPTFAMLDVAAVVAFVARTAEIGLTTLGWTRIEGAFVGEADTVAGS